MTNINTFHEKNLLNIVNLFLSRNTQDIINNIEEDSYKHIQRKIFVDDIINKFIKFASRYKEKPDHLIIIRWFYTQKLLDNTNIDPIIPYNIDDNEGFFYDMEKYRAPKEEIIEFLEYIYFHIGQFQLKKSYNIISPTFMYDKDEVCISLGNIKFKINELTYNKLYKLYTKNNQDDNFFYSRLFNLLCRYYTLSSPGYHAAIPQELFEILKTKLNISHELFASPFNCYNNLMNYCSAYYDTDKYFGSIGNFFSIYKELFINGGSFEANPPFLEEHMISLSTIIITQLDNDVPLSFVVVFPTWKDSISYKMLYENKYNVLDNKVLLFEEGKHKYTQSSQFWNKLGTKRVSNSKSCIFILQNEKGKKKYLLTDNIIKDIIDSFAI